jgi:hypothetical protein
MVPAPVANVISWVTKQEPEERPQTRHESKIDCPEPLLGLNRIVPRVHDILRIHSYPRVGLFLMESTRLFYPNSLSKHFKPDSFLGADYTANLQFHAFVIDGLLYESLSVSMKVLSVHRVSRYVYG